MTLSCERIIGRGSALNGFIPQPLQKQYVANCQEHGSNEQPEKTVGNHAANHTNKNDRHWDFKSATEHQWFKEVVAEPGNEGPDRKDDRRRGRFRRENIDDDG